MVRWGYHGTATDSMDMERGENGERGEGGESERRATSQEPEHRRFTYAHRVGRAVVSYDLGAVCGSDAVCRGVAPDATFCRSACAISEASFFVASCGLFTDAHSGCGCEIWSNAKKRP